MRFFLLELDHRCHLFGCRLSVESGLSDRGESDHAPLCGVERVVLADSDVLSGNNACASLSDDDHASPCFLTIVDLCSEEFWLGIA